MNGGGSNLTVSPTVAGVLIVAFIAALASPLEAHRGGLDEFGCHHDKKIGGYHCHNGEFVGQEFRSIGAMLKQLRSGGDEPAALGIYSGTTTPSAVGRVSVVDGDTLEIRGGRIRLWGIDAPESAQTCVVQGKPWRVGQHAALALSDHLGQRTVSCQERDRDRYGRLVATCSLKTDDIGSWLVRHGWALDWPKYSRGAYAKEQAAARSKTRGIWQCEKFELPWEWRRR